MQTYTAWLSKEGASGRWLMIQKATGRTLTEALAVTEVWLSHAKDLPERRRVEIVEET